MNKFSSSLSFLIVVFVLLSGIAASTAYAQLEEPEVVRIEDPRTPFSEGFRNSLGVDIMVNNFGFGLGGTYGRVIAPYTELTFHTGITGIRDVSEQNFQSFLTGQQIIPNKYKRGFGFPFLLGIKQRIFARQVEDNLRFFISGAGGPAMALLMPYLRDNNNPNGFRDFRITQQGFLVPVEDVNDFFSGWGDAESKWGLNGEIKIGVDIGREFGTRTTVEFGYFFYYFDSGLQIMEPFRPTQYNEEGLPVEESKEPFYDAQKHFGTPQIKITFGGMW